MCEVYAIMPVGKPVHVETFETVEDAVNSILQHWHEEESVFRCFFLEVAGCVVGTMFSGADSDYVTVTVQRPDESIVSNYRVRYILDSDGSYKSTEIQVLGFNKAHNTR